MFCFHKQRTRWSCLDPLLFCSTWQAHCPFPDPNQGRLMSGNSSCPVIAQLRGANFWSRAGHSTDGPGVWGCACLQLSRLESARWFPRHPVWEFHLKIGIFTEYSVNTNRNKQMASWLSELPKPTLCPSNWSLDGYLFQNMHNNNPRYISNTRYTPQTEQSSEEKMGV